MEAEIRKEYERWQKEAVMDPALCTELAEMEGNDEAVTDAFYRDLEFGTGGLRGVIGAGTNRMNVYTVAKASQGLSDYVKAHFPAGARRIAVSRDSRINSELFARIAAGVFAANEIEVSIYTELMPTPCLSYAVRKLHCAAGIMVTASHNPAKYNGYKVYGADGCQITTEAAAEILREIEKLDIFRDVRFSDFEEGIAGGRISYIAESVYTDFVEEVKRQSVLGPDEKTDRNVSIVYSPLNGTGLKPVLRTLHEAGFTNITVVKEQEKPDGRFPTCPYPNPEIREAMALGIEYARKNQAELLLATDPDCDRVGIAVRNPEGDYTLLSGNETGMLLLDYICAQRTKHGTMPADPVLVKTIVTTDMGEQIAAHYGVRTVNVLTGFKFIGEQIGRLEKEGREASYIFGFEESYGYLSGGYVRDKDAVDGAFLIAEMAAYYRAGGISLLDRLAELYRTYGYCRNTLHSYTFEGAAGFEKMQAIMQTFHETFKAAGAAAGEGAAERQSDAQAQDAGKPAVTAFADRKIREVLDYKKGIDGLPKSDVLKYLLEGHCSVVVRPSGTEPKLKTYISVSAPSMEAAEAEEKKISAALETYLG